MGGVLAPPIFPTGFHLQNFIIQNKEFEIVEKFKCLYEPAPYKIAYGGRGGAKSVSMAQAALILGAMRPLRVGCFREIQKSIKESVHELLKQEIYRMDLVAPNGAPFYEVLDHSIRGVNGTEFFFMGLRHNLNSIKSVANIDLAWVEEAEPISDEAWSVFLPTVRRDAPWGPFGEGSEFWIGFNPGFDTSATWRRFVENPPTGAKLIEVNYWDNPFFPEILRRQMEDAKKIGGDAYDNVWAGKPRVTIDGAIYAKQIANAELEDRITDLPWIRSKPVNTYWDLGRRDLTAVWFVQPVGSYFHVIDYLEGRGMEMSEFIPLLQAKGYTYGINFLPHDGANEYLVTNRTSESILRAAGFRVRLIPRVSKKQISIDASRVIFDQCKFDRNRTFEGLQRLRRYKYEIKDGQYSRDPKHDDNSNGADAFQQLGLHQKEEDEIMVVKKKSSFHGATVVGNQGWMA